MTDLSLAVFERDSILVVDSRLLAFRLGVEHINFMETVTEYQTRIEQAFGIVRFETEKTGKRGRPQKYCLLTEDQSFFVMTLSRNTEQVIQCKIDLVAAFSKAKKILASPDYQYSRDRMEYRKALKDDARLNATNQIKAFLERINRYDDKKYAGYFFARFHDELNIALTGETAKSMKQRLANMLGQPVSDSVMIRDYFPAMDLLRYVTVCTAAGNMMSRHGAEPFEALRCAVEDTMSPNFTPTPIDFEGYVWELQQGSDNLLAG